MHVFRRRGLVRSGHSAMAPNSGKGRRASEAWVGNANSSQGVLACSKETAGKKMMSSPGFKFSPRPDEVRRRVVWDAAGAGAKEACRSSLTPINADLQITEALSDFLTTPDTYILAHVFMTSSPREPLQFHAAF